MSLLKKLNLVAGSKPTQGPEKPVKDPIGKKKDVEDFQKGFNKGGSLKDSWKNLKKVFE